MELYTNTIDMTNPYKMMVMFLILLILIIIVVCSDLNKKTRVKRVTTAENMLE